jgi:glycosyltransferase involved in cell wall biosynthesis
MIRSGSQYEVATLRQAFQGAKQRQADTFAISGLGRWSFSPSALRVFPLVRGCDFVTLHSLYSFPVLAGYLAAIGLGKPYGLWPHGVLAPVQRRIHSGRKTLYNSMFSRRILDQASVLFYSAEGEREETRPLNLKAPSVIIPHGVDIEPFAKLPARGAFRDAHLGGHRGPLVLYLGRLNEKKGVDILIEAADAIVAAVPDTMFAIAGGSHPPSFEKRIAEWIRRSPVRDRIVMTGVASEAQKVEAFADADVFVLPSEAENFGFAMFEAMSAQVPVVVSESLDYAHQVRRACAGLTAPRNVEAFASAIVSLLRDRERRAVMGRNGLALASYYSWTRCGRLIETALEAILRREPFPAELQPEYPA